MSIINEALKKAQLENEQFKKRVGGEKPRPTVKSRAPKSSTKIPWLAVLIIVPVLILFLIRFRPTTETATHPGKEYRLPVTRDYKIPEIFKRNQDRVTYPTRMPKEFPSPPSLQLSGIVWGRRGAQAIINNKILETGDKIDRATIVRIEKDEVILSFANQEITLTLK